MDATAPARILLVDADRGMLATLVRGLASACFEVEGVDDGRRALEICSAAAPDMVVIDHEIPGFDGLQLAEALQQAARVPFMFLSTRADPEVADRAAEAGALAYLVKPVDSTRLIPAIRTALARSRQMAAMRRELERMNDVLGASRDASVVTGLLMERYGLNQASAYERLRRYARGQRRKLVEVAAEILSDADRLRTTLQDVVGGDAGDRRK